MTGTKAAGRVGQYELVRELGAGAMATVHEAVHVALGKRVALKRMHPHHAADAAASARFLREGRAAAKIRSPHVVDVFDVGTDGGVPYLVMELLEGVDLAAHLSQRGRIPLAELARLVVPIASAVHAAHEAGVVHRDLKPSNVFLAQREGKVVPVLLDFGISRSTADVEPNLTGSAVLLGTVHYMSPEQTLGGKHATALSDQYALGVMLYECSTGVKPFSGSTPYSLMHAIVSSRVRPPSELSPGLPGAFDDVVLRAMQRDPQKRFPDVRALGEALRPWADGGAVVTRRRLEAGNPPPSRPRVLLRRLRPWAALAVGATAAIVGVAASSRSLARRDPPIPRASAAPAAPSAASDLAPASPQPQPDPSAAPAPQPIAPVSADAPSALAIKRDDHLLPQQQPRPRPQPNAPARQPTAERGTNGAFIV